MGPSLPSPLLPKESPRKAILNIQIMVNFLRWEAFIRVRRRIDKPLPTH